MNPFGELLLLRDALPNRPIGELSSATGEGIDAWMADVLDGGKAGPPCAPVRSLRARSGGLCGDDRLAENDLVAAKIPRAQPAGQYGRCAVIRRTTGQKRCHVNGQITQVSRTPVDRQRRHAARVPAARWRQPDANHFDPVSAR